MFTSESIDAIRKAVNDCAERDRDLLDRLRADVRRLSGSVRVIQQRQTTSVAMVASDGGNNRVEYDPFLVQLIRVVDSLGKELCLEAVSPTTDTGQLSASQFRSDGSPRTSLGYLLRDLEVAGQQVSELAYGSIPSSADLSDPDNIKPGWVQTYRDIWEWAVLYERICYGNFGTDTLLVRDGLLRAKFIRPPYFVRMIELLEAAIARHAKQEKRQVFLVGLAKHSKVIQRYRLAMTIENTIPAGSARYVEIPQDMEMAAYAWAEWTTDPNFVAGQLHMVRFGRKDGDPIWAIDLLKSQVQRAQEIFGYLLTDARDGFPVPLYPGCLQRAHEHAEVADWDLDMFQDALISAVRLLVPEGRRDAVDASRLMTDATGRRYA